ncbi:MAG: hypothetical protein HOM36_03420 [Phycisphaerae bacterium]|nr:hypothetical protein [Phycisphaerae bacterium]
MNDSFQILLTSWNPDWVAIVGALAICLVYVRGWKGLHRRQPEKYPTYRLWSFITGIGIIVLAIVSPLDTFANVLLQVHMAQHILLMMVAPPLLWIGWPALPLLCGLPSTVQKKWLGPFLASKNVHSIGRFFVHPITALVLFTVSTWAWHYPSAYKLALSNDLWHSIEHFCFIGTALLFWFPVVSPEPSTPSWPTWALIPYLLAADILNTIFSAFFSFANEPIYDFYPDLGLFGTTLMRDQAAAGAIMWVASSALFLIPVAVILRGMLTNKENLESPALPKPIIQSKKPRRTRWLYSNALRTCAQSVMFLLAIAVICDGLLGPELGPLNLAGILPWIWWRGLVIIAILVAGNVFCWACPFMFVRSIATKLPITKTRWPLRTKWIAVALFVLWLLMYEVLSPWSSPAFTAWIVIGYFVAAFCIDALFTGAAFCKWVCPIGQFHFVLSMVSPFEIAALKKSTCASCTTQDCIQGNVTHNGCELELFIPTKQGNLDCTFCLDCVRACPHDNVSIMPTFPASDLLDDDFRGSIRSLDRNDYTALMLVFVFGAFANAAGMIAPINNAIDAVSRWLGASSTHLVTAGFILTSVFIVPTILLYCIKKATQTSNHVAWSLVPLGVGMWASHLLFHFFTSYQSIMPVTQRALHDLGYAVAPTQIWGMASSPEWLLQGELFLLGVSFLASFAICLRLTTTLQQRVTWGTTIALLFVAGAWILLQPMQMRGMIG